MLRLVLAVAFVVALLAPAPVRADPQPPPTSSPPAASVQPAPAAEPLPPHRSAVRRGRRRGRGRHGRGLAVGSGGVCVERVATLGQRWMKPKRASSAVKACRRVLRPTCMTSRKRWPPSTATMHRRARCLGALARRFNVKALLVVVSTEGHVTARAFLSDIAAFDAATYAPDAGPTLAWAGAARSLARLYAGEPAVVSSGGAGESASPRHARRSPRVAEPATHPKRFWESGWFWGAIGAAAFAAGAVYFATRDNSDPTIHLEMQVPH